LTAVVLFPDVAAAANMMTVLDGVLYKGMWYVENGFVFCFVACFT
jgi:hypothetical protein